MKKIKNMSKNHKVRILFLDQGETLGGAERFLLDFFDSLTASDFSQITCAVLGAQHPSYKKRCGRFVTVLPWTYPSVKGGFFTKIRQSIRLFVCALRTQKRLRLWRADHIVTNSPRTHFVMLLMKMFLREPRPWHAVFHDFSIPRPLVRFLGRYTTTLIANSTPTRTFIREAIEDRYFPKIRIIENSIVPHKKTWPPPDRLQKVLVLGRIDPQKGQRYALEAAEILSNRSASLQFIIVGSPFEKDPRTLEYDREIHQFVRDRGLRNVRFESEVDSPFSAIAKCDCLLALPTEPETFGRIVVEALSMNKLVLSFDETGPREILKNYEQFLGSSVQPLLIESQNAFQLAERIAGFADHPEKIKLFAEKGAAFVKENYSADETKKRFLALF